MSWPTPQGWMLLVAHAARKDTSSSRSAFLWNPLTGDKVPLPDIGEEHERSPGTAGASSPTTTQPTRTAQSCSSTTPPPKCGTATPPTAPPAVVPAGSTTPTTSATTLCRRRTAPQPRRSSPILHGRFVPRGTPPDQLAYGHVRHRSLITHPRSHVPALRRPTPRHNFPPGMSTGKDWLVESRGELFLVCIRFVGFDPDDIGAIFVYKMDDSSSSSTRAARWRRVRDIGDAVFLLEDANMAVSCPAAGKRSRAPCQPGILHEESQGGRR